MHSRTLRIWNTARQCSFTSLLNELLQQFVPALDELPDRQYSVVHEHLLSLYYAVSILPYKYRYDKHIFIS
jgi:hypothetical protein